MIRPLANDEIERVLRAGVVGRIGCHADGRTYVVPVSVDERRPDRGEHPDPDAEPREHCSAAWRTPWCAAPTVRCCCSIALKSGLI